jgi:hypothetical protein
VEYIHPYICIRCISRTPSLQNSPCVSIGRQCMCDNIRHPSLLQLAPSAHIHILTTHHNAPSGGAEDLPLIDIPPPRPKKKPSRPYPRKDPNVPPPAPRTTPRNTNTSAVRSDANRAVTSHVNPVVVPIEETCDNLGHLEPGVPPLSGSLTRSTVAAAMGARRGPPLVPDPTPNLAPPLLWPNAGPATAAAIAAATAGVGGVSSGLAVGNPFHHQPSNAHHALPIPMQPGGAGDHGHMHHHIHSAPGTNPGAAGLLPALPGLAGVSGLRLAPQSAANYDRLTVSGYHFHPGNAGGGTGDGGPHATAIPANPSTAAAAAAITAPFPTQPLVGGVGGPGPPLPVDAVMGLGVMSLTEHAGSLLLPSGLRVSHGGGVGGSGAVFRPTEVSEQHVGVPGVLQGAVHHMVGSGSTMDLPAAAGCGNNNCDEPRCALRQPHQATSALLASKQPHVAVELNERSLAGRDGDFMGHQGDQAAVGMPDSSDVSEATIAAVAAAASAAAAAAAAAVIAAAGQQVQAHLQVCACAVSGCCWRVFVGASIFLYLFYVCPFCNAYTRATRTRAEQPFAVSALSGAAACSTAGPGQLLPSRPADTGWTHGDEQGRAQPRTHHHQQQQQQRRRYKLPPGAC